jgi:pyruvate carboxylase subunit A
VSIRKVFVANRGEIAVRVLRACRELGLQTAVGYSEADRHAWFVALADEAVPLGPAPASESYLHQERVLQAARACGADALHPGYGFLSENATFADRCQEAGLRFVGPPPAAIRAMGDKVAARQLMRQAGVPVVPGTDALAEDVDAGPLADALGFPVMVKAAGGGGGIGMRVVTRSEGLADAVTACRAAGRRSFGNPSVYLEKYVAHPRHIEIQVLADGEGRVVHLGERECSIQRRHQKILEEAPSTALSQEQRTGMGAAAVQAARAVGYRNAGTVEFIYSEGTFYFLEMNTRLQVEHPITEATWGVDLVRAQLRIAAGEPLPWSQGELQPRGHAFEFRVNAEDPARNFLPAPGRVTRYLPPGGPGVRVDSALAQSGAIPPQYDSLIAKLIVWGADREEALARSARALREYLIVGVKTNLALHHAIVEHEAFRAGRLTTNFLSDHPELFGALDRFTELQAPLLPALDDARRAAAAAAAAAATTSG